tara:strand:- start:500 stop:775 length:276 start_codon:yes stop_codon:yes gene_type:complete
MKITKRQLKKIIKEELNELTSDEVGMMPAPSGTDQGVQIVRRHLGMIVAELAEGGLDPAPDHSTAHTGITPDLDGLAFDVYKMIMGEMGGQ